MEPVVLNSLKVAAVILKVRQQPTGMTYVASHTCPFKNCSFVVRFVCPEQFPTGLRDTAVMTQLNLAGTLNLERFPEGWVMDPYLGKSIPGAMYNLADAPEYDAQFPDHPLSRGRKYLAAASAQLKIDPRLPALLEPFLS